MMEIEVEPKLLYSFSARLAEKHLSFRLLYMLYTIPPPLAPTEQINVFSRNSHL